ncbi:alanine--glyoxylate aminotransferase 23, mitochondrial-like [Dorcoceras hygrometricum]|uniref:Alanine--glyoxylate aminotransferase 23, mitochondrial-like n=1 Tax=Dorcoceras hygrometricum TaxID=472368 RepID=A0A2Z6ZYT1_9LAMI|nr:alanine--glyoxylate aminotransferase 23, mitochondrial-like [Dorcoceras hygrometricum]
MKTSGDKSGLGYARDSLKRQNSEESSIAGKPSIWQGRYCGLASLPGNIEIIDLTNSDTVQNQQAIGVPAVSAGSHNADPDRVPTGGEHVQVDDPNPQVVSKEIQQDCRGNMMQIDTQHEASTYRVR